MQRAETAPDFSSILENNPDEYTDRRVRRHERAPTFRQKMKRALAHTAIGTTFATGVLTGALQYDIHKGKELVADSEPSIEHIYNPANPEYIDAATVILPGFGTRNAKYAAERLQSHTKTGHVFALEYSNKDIDIDELTNTVIQGLKDQETASGTRIEYVNFDGYSMGGIILLAVAANIHKNYPDITVTSIALNSTPIGAEGLTQGSSDSIETLGSIINFCNIIKLCEGIEYSPTVQRIAEIANRHDDYFDTSSFTLNTDELQNSIQAVDQKLSEPDAASPALVLSQASALEGASNHLLRDAQEEFHREHGVEQSIETLSRTIDEKPPVSIFYTMAEDPSEDPVVDVRQSATALQALADTYGAELEIVPLSVGHVNLYTQSAQYDEFITTYVNPVVEEATAESPVIMPGSASFFVNHTQR